MVSVPHLLYDSCMLAWPETARARLKIAETLFLCASTVAALGSSTPVCAGNVPAPASAVTARSSAAKIIRTLPVFYDSAMTAQGFPSPLVRVRIAEHEAIFLVDSGASTHVLADWFVKKAGISSAETDSTAQGSSGKTTRERVVHQLEGHWGDGQSFNLNEAVVVAFPRYFESLRIGGLVSPQLLAPPGTAAVLDLKIPALHFSPFARALSDLQLSELPPVAIGRTQACRNRESVLVNRQYVTRVSLGRAADLMLVDTGATKTILSRDSKIAQVVEGRNETSAPSESVGGEVDARRMVRGVRLLRGGKSIALDPSIGGVSASCNAKGILGMDALRGCVLVLGASDLALSCG
jgi:hypothetical protein